MGENNDFFFFLKETNIWKNYPACKELTHKNLSNIQVTILCADIVDSNSQTYAEWPLIE